MATDGDDRADVEAGTPFSVARSAPVYRHHQLRPVIETGAAVMDDLFGA